jgi:Flp pilus assembly CpaF family ATPase
VTTQRDAAGSVVGEVRSAVLAALEDRDRVGDGLRGDLEQAFANDVIASTLGDIAQRRVTAGDMGLSVEDEDWVRGEVLASLYGLGPLERLLADEHIENVVMNGFDDVLVYLADGQVEQVAPLFGSNDELVGFLARTAAHAGRTERRFDRGEPFLDVRLPDGSRLHAAREVCEPPVTVTIRKHRFLKVSLADLVGMGTIDTALHDVLAAAVDARLNVLVCGGTDAGKTTFVRALAEHVDPRERIVVIEDDAELDLSRHRTNVVGYEARRPNTEGAGSVAMAELVRQARRARPDRIVVGEVRGGEAFEMLDSMSLGNDGSMCTLHANSTAAAFSKTIEFVQRANPNFSDTLAARMIANALDLVVHIHKPDRLATARVVSSVREITGCEGPRVDSNEVFVTGPDGRAQPGYPFTQPTMDRLIDAGLDPDVLARAEGWWDQ